MSFEVQSSARVSEDSSPTTPPTLTPAQKRGLKYQAKVEAELERLYPGRVLLRPWFRYKINGEVKKCQPDAILMNSDWTHAVIVEIKYSTIPEAWHKLSTLYKSVVEKAYRIPTSLCLITRVFDPHVGFPCSILQLEGLERLDGFKNEGLGVVSWK